MGIALDNLLRDRDLLCKALGHETPVASGLCPFCSSTNTLKIFESQNGHSAWNWTCINPSCKSFTGMPATLIEALMLLDGKPREEIVRDLVGTEEAEGGEDADSEVETCIETEDSPPPATRPVRNKISESELLSIKQDGSILREALGIAKDGNHCVCPWCKKTNMRVGPDMKGGTQIYMFQCMTGCGQGTIIDAIMKLENKTLPEAMAAVQQRYSYSPTGQKRPPPRPPTQPLRGSAETRRDPVIDLVRAEKFVTYAHTELTTRGDLQKKFLTKRHISLDVVKKFRLGFMDKFTVPMLGKDGKPNWDWAANNAWVLPITDVGGNLMAVKLHFEEIPPNFHGKSLWVNFGTYPKHDSANNIMPVCAYYTLWPHIEHQVSQTIDISDEITLEWYTSKLNDELREKLQTKITEKTLMIAADAAIALEDLRPHHHEQAKQEAFNDMSREIQEAVLKAEAKQQGKGYNAESPKDFVVIAGGELKAFAAISSGLIATSVTGGEGALPEFNHFACMRGKNVLLAIDDDPAKRTENGKLVCAGRKFATDVKSMLIRHKAKKIWEMPTARGGAG